MVKSCFKCGRNSKKDKNVTLFSIPTKTKNAKWHMDFVKRLGIEGSSSNLKICNKHFNPDDLEKNGPTVKLKIDALPMIENEEDEKSENVEVQPEIIYLNYEEDGNELLADSDTEAKEYEAKDFAPLEPVVEFVGAYDGKQESGINIEQPDRIEPMMPFFLTSSTPVFTILNGDDEEGETIILQIEDRKEGRPASESDVRDLERHLCASQRPDGCFACDACDGSYGCLNCLKSHYGTAHVTGAVTRYKCHYSVNVSRGLVCPVCDLVFDSKNDAVDHYVGHAVACSMCGLGFDRQLHLTEHYAKEHGRTDVAAEHGCDLCRRTFDAADQLAAHYQSAHKLILCHVCKLRFGTTLELSDHDGVHRRERRVLPFACSKCDKAFPKISDIAVHIRQDHRADGGQKVRSGPPAGKKAKVGK